MTVNGAPPEGFEPIPEWCRFLAGNEGELVTLGEIPAWLAPMHEWAKEQERISTGRIYFIIEDVAPFNVKIGYCSTFPIGRLTAMQTGNPRPLRLVRHFAGNLALEERALDTLSPARIRGEWFRMESITMAFMLCSTASVAHAIAIAAIRRRKCGL